MENKDTTATTTAFTLSDLREVMRACAGESKSVDLNGDIADTTFVDLGYDSLALLEMTVRVGNRLGVVIPDHTAGDDLTPGMYVDWVSLHAAAAGR
jgi:act minimal PKS acyl carrier protein